MKGSIITTQARRWFVRGCWFALLLGAGLVVALAQQTDLATKLRLGQSLEQVGEWGRAAALYESLLAEYPQSFVIVEGLRRVYVELKEYNKAIALIRKQLGASPADESLLTTLGSVYDLAGQPQTADSLWQLVIAKDVKNASLYRLVAAQLIDHRQYDRAIQIYLQGREGTKNSAVFVEELGSLYGALHNYEAATTEYLKLVELNPQQVSYVQSRLASFTGRPEGRRAAIGIVSETIRKEPERVPLRVVHGWLLVEGKEYDAALEEYRIIDRLTKANGLELFQFGQRASQEHAYGIASRAFREALNLRLPPNIVPYAKYGYARSVEELSVLNDSIARSDGPSSAPGQQAFNSVTETWRSFEGVLKLYESVLAEFPASDVGMQALFRIGAIRFVRLFDLDGAAGAFRNVRDLPYNPPLQQEAAINLAEVETARNDLAAARRDYLQLLNSGQDFNRDKVRFRLAELDYFEGKFDTASSSLQLLGGTLKSDEANDALQLLYFIQENKGSAEVLPDFARADLLVRQRKYSEAASRFQVLTERFPSASLVDDAALRLAELQLLMNRPSEALNIFRRIVIDMPTSVLRDRAQMRIAEVYEQSLHNKAKAIEAYEMVLEQFSTSLFVEEARKRIRLLRGDAL